MRIAPHLSLEASTTSMQEGYSPVESCTCRGMLFLKNSRRQFPSLRAVDSKFAGYSSHARLTQGRKPSTCCLEKEVILHQGYVQEGRAVQAVGRKDLELLHAQRMQVGRQLTTESFRSCCRACLWSKAMPRNSYAAGTPVDSPSVTLH